MGTHWEFVRQFVLGALLGCLAVLIGVGLLDWSFTVSLLAAVVLTLLFGLVQEVLKSRRGTSA
jgi:ABC-type uncharacterized transport system permease subunit